MNQGYPIQHEQTIDEHEQAHHDLAEALSPKHTLAIRSSDPDGSPRMSYEVSHGDGQFDVGALGPELQETGSVLLVETYVPGQSRSQKREFATNGRTLIEMPAYDKTKRTYGSPDQPVKGWTVDKVPAIAGTLQIGGQLLGDQGPYVNRVTVPDTLVDPQSGFSYTTVVRRDEKERIVTNGKPTGMNTFHTGGAEGKVHQAAKFLYAAEARQAAKAGPAAAKVGRVAVAGNGDTRRSHR